MKNFDFTFKSLAAMSQFIDATPPKGIFKNAVLSSTNKSEYVCKFSGTTSLDEANELMFGGWQAGADKVVAYMMKSKAGRNSTTPTIYNSVVGFAPCVPAYLSGNPLNMYNQTQTPNRKKIVSITYNIGVDHKVAAEDIQAAAAKLFNVIVGLEKQGINTELYICYISGIKTDQVLFSVCIKQAARPFNLLSVAYPFVHSSMLRRHGFAIIERAGVRSKKWPKTYGYPRIGITAAECKRVGIPAENVFSYYTLKDKSEKEIAEMLK